MEIREFDKETNQEYWMNQINKSDWGAGKYLYKLLRDGKVKELFGENTRVLMLTQGDELVSFCTLAKQDEIRDLRYTPWIGFVYTFPEKRGHRYVGMLLRRAYELAKEEGAEYIYISTGETGLYEKYGYTFYQMMKDDGGEDSRVYRIKVESR